MDSNKDNSEDTCPRRPVRKIITDAHTVLSPEEYKYQEEIKKKVDWYEQLRAQRSPYVNRDERKIQGYYDALQDPEVKKIVNGLAYPQNRECPLPVGTHQASPPPVQQEGEKSEAFSRELPIIEGKRGWQKLRNLFHKKD